jgi:pyruvate-formate lyase-activating enzyme
MMKKTPLFIEIKGNSLDDGPGIRSVIFFKGCPLSCVWCHNPEENSLLWKWLPPEKMETCRKIFKDFYCPEI